MSTKAADNYANVYDTRIGFGHKPALILVDFVEAYFDKSCDLYAGVDDTLASAIRVRDAARKAGILIIYTNVVYHKSGINGGRFYQKAAPLRYFLEGSPMGAWPKGLVPSDNELVISKQYPSAFFATSLASTLHAAGIDTAIITGLTTSGCVRATCVDACSNGFIPIVVEQACGDRHDDPHNANLFDMNAKYGDVISEQEIIKFLGEL
ncbi:isochorismatase family protein [Glaciecola sp. 33A]|jgi:maleamate amidohydrolase|uniref:isochorismatase family protein n=1 Tax=Glaciecola sp. 33A TaxID=2057807 RepID=UPI000C344ACF|nr:isochorismatase family protein [Glaciecola sp. 33A]PKI01269.1 isochorismatase [Glaciecola sp. 33A]